MIAHNRPTLGKEEEEASVRVLRSGWLKQGREVEYFENEFCDFIGLPPGHAVAVSNGTSALFLALWALKAKGRRVAFPAYVCSALRHAVAMTGAEEVLIDSQTVTPNINLNMITQSKAPIAIVPHLFGLPEDLSSISGATTVIEDCCQALGSKVNGIPVGLQGEIGIYSFFVTKLLTSGGQGGMLVSKNASIVAAVRDYREFDMRRDNQARFNFQMTDLQAAIGRVQLRKLPAFLQRREDIYGRYREAGLALLDAAGSKSTVQPVRYRAIVRIASAREQLKALKQNGVVSIVPLEDWELLGDAKDFPMAHRWTQETLSLPLYPSLADAEVDTILNAMKEWAV